MPLSLRALFVRFSYNCESIAYLHLLFHSFSVVLPSRLLIVVFIYATY
jgi:hypothetical protein